ncbi:MAG: hypothetical protein ACE15F_13445 [bacterium]
MARKRNPSPEPRVYQHPKLQPLVRLSDQGSPVEVSHLLGDSKRQPLRGSYAENFLAANSHSLAALNISSELALANYEMTVRLRPGGVIGAVPLYAPDTRKITTGVVVRPRYDWDGIGLLLQQVGWSAAPRILSLPLVPGSAREVPPWVLAGPILTRLSRLVKEIRRGFRMREEVRQSPRGQILWTRYATELASHGAFHQLPCRFSDLGPDLLLQSYLRWGIEKVWFSLIPFSNHDTIARHLALAAESLLFELRHIRSQVPDHSILDRWLLFEGLPSDYLRGGLQALGWLVDERGLGDTSENDGLAWCLPMHELFERWVECLARLWAHQFGGHVRSVFAGETTIPIRWSQAGQSSLKSLAPDIVVHNGDHVLIIDAKYKSHFEELDDHRWAEMGEDLREQHRHDVHQVLAYAALFETAPITAMLVYPMQETTWERLSRRGRALAQAELNHHGRTLTLALAGLPLKIPPGARVDDLIASWDRLRR